MKDPKQPQHASKPLVLSALTLIIVQSLPGAAAPVAPDAGQTLRELQQQPVLNAPVTAPPPAAAEQEPEAEQGDAAHFRIKRIQLSGNREISTAQLHPLVAALEGGEHTLTELNAAARRITDYYRQHGYTVARAYVPAQEIKDGVVAINILEGRIDKYRLNNQARLSDERASAYVKQVQEGGAIVTAQIDRGLLLLNDTPGVGSSRAVLQPGSSVGTSDLVVELTPSAPYSAYVTLDNYGNRYTGETRLGGMLSLNSPLRIGDQLSFSALTSGSSLNFGRIAYQLPVGSNGLRVGAAYFKTRYYLGKEFTVLTAHGKATSSSIFASYPFIRSRQHNLTGVITWEQKNLSDFIDATATVAAKRVHLANLGLSGNEQDVFGGGGVSSLDLSLAFGRLYIESLAALAIDAASARTNGAYTRLFYKASRLQRLGTSNQLYLAISGQQANRNLDTSEKFALGGAFGVRAYPQGEAIGDAGYLATLELRHDFTDSLQGVLFYDTGRVVINRYLFGTPVPNTRNLAGAGVGLNATVSGYGIKTLIAWPTDGGQPNSIPAGAAHNPNIWAQVDKSL